MHIPQGFKKKLTPSREPCSQVKPWFPIPLVNRQKTISSHYSHRNCDHPYSISAFPPQCDVDLITSLWQHELRTTEKSEVIILHPFGVFVKH